MIANLNYRLKNPQSPQPEQQECSKTIDLLNSKLEQERTGKEELEEKLRNLEEKIEQVI